MDRWLAKFKNNSECETVEPSDKNKDDRVVFAEESTIEPIHFDPTDADEPSTSSAGLFSGQRQLAKTKGLGATKRRKYDERYIKYGFTCIILNDEPRPQCVICSEVLANDSLKPVKLIRHLNTKHPTYKDKPVDFFRRKDTMLASQKLTMTKQSTVTAKALTASFDVAHLIAKAKKPHTIAETLIRPAAMAICRTMHGDKLASDIEQIPLSDNTISRRISEMANDVKCQLVERIKDGKKFSLQLDESTDISNAAQLLVFVRYCHEGKLLEDLLFCCVLEGTCTGRDIFDKVDSKLGEVGLRWNNCVGVCTDGAGAMLGKNKGLSAMVRNVAPHVRFTHCMIHREALASKTLPSELNSVLQTATQIVNHIKTRPVKSRLFGLLCKEMGSEHESLLLHTEVRWLSRGKVLQRLFSLRDELRMFLLDCASSYAEYFSDPKWLAHLAYLSDIFDRLNTLNSSLQGPNSNILSMSDKIEGFMRKLE